MGVQRMSGWLRLRLMPDVNIPRRIAMRMTRRALTGSNMDHRAMRHRSMGHRAMIHAHVPHGQSGNRSQGRLFGPHAGLRSESGHDLP
jgi:hypothetical protein